MASRRRPRVPPSSLRRKLAIRPSEEAIEVLREALVLSVRATFAEVTGQLRLDAVKRPSDRKVREAADRAARLTSEANGRALRRIPGIDAAKVAGGEEQLARFRARAVNLIRNISTQFRADIAKTLSEHAGEHPSTLAKVLQKRLGVAENKARVWARDQTNKLNSEVTRARFARLGITRYAWTTAKDERVRGNPNGLYPKARPSHWDRDGKVYDLEAPPEDGHAGEPILCRCTQFPILD